MNIKKAKKHIKNAMTAYFTKDEFGNYRIPIEKQRPVFLMGPPGIGKTAIMEQVAEEMGVGLVSYSMTHHTRQSALGLPYIETKVYDGKEYSVSEYTMSEIIASVYDMIEKTGLKEGILFLDEINCVSETLAPAMLQFLQYKIFGRHKVPEGWIVVTAGNPPEYNNSVRQFDIVTWDRLKRIDIEPDFEVWKEYAYKSGVHPAVTTYLDIKRSEFYKIETTVDGKSFVTARGWSDLSEMIKLYEENDIEVDFDLIVQYIQNRKIAKQFSIYYDLFKKYRSDYQIDTILEGKASAEIKARAKDAKFDERLSLIGLILDGINTSVKELTFLESSLKELMPSLKTIKSEFDRNTDFIEIVNKENVEINDKIEKGRVASTLSMDSIKTLYKAIEILDNIKKKIFEKQPSTGNEAFKCVKEVFDEKRSQIKKHSKDIEKQFENIFAFAEEVFGEGQEILIIVTELTRNVCTANFITRYGCDVYFRHNKDLLIYERQQALSQEISELDL